MEKTEEIRAGGYLPASFLDWEGHVAAVIFTCGCNFRCPWCHNGALALSRAEALPLDKIMADIERRAAFLDGVVISGGEPTLWPGLAPLLRRVRALSLPVKLDTNGSRPEILRALFAEGLVDHAAMDVKAPLDCAAYGRLTGTAVDIEKILSSVEIIKSHAPAYEFRTTYIPALLTADDLRVIRRQLADDAHWRLQLFKPNGCLDPSYLNASAASAEVLRKAFPGIDIRG